MTKCAVPHCPNRNEVDTKERGITFHRLPHNREDILMQWIVNLNRKNWSPSKRTLLCSDHFAPDCFIRKRHRSFLKRDAVPTIFKAKENSKKNSGNGKAVNLKRKRSHSDEIHVKATRHVDNFLKQFPKSEDAKGKNDNTSNSNLEQRNYVFDFKDGDNKYESVDIPGKSLGKAGENHLSNVAKQSSNAICYESEDKGNSYQPYKNKYTGSCSSGHSGLNSGNLDSLLRSLFEKRLLCNYSLEILQAFGEYPRKLVKLRDVSTDFHIHHSDLEDELMQFSTVLYFSSPAAYNIVGDIFQLPSLLELRNHIKINGYRPGFTQKALSILRSKVSKSNDGQFCCIMFDFISIDEVLNSDTINGEHSGFVNIGGGKKSAYRADEIPIAQKVLMFIAVGLNKDWKLPFGYFLCKDLSGEILKNITEEAIYVLEECGLQVRALACSGSKCNIKMGELYGCKIHPKKTTGKRMHGKNFVGITTHFSHPFDRTRKIYLVFSIRHSLKLLMNLLEDKGTLLSSVYGVVDWKFIKNLYMGSAHNCLSNQRFQQNTEFARFCHLQQTISLCQPYFSSSLTGALEIAGALELYGFDDVESTTNFASDVQRASELLNSRNPVTTEDKQSICTVTFDEQEESMLDIADRLINLETIVGRRITEEGRWTSVTLIAFTLVSVSQLASDLLQKNTVRYFSTYRIDLDHWEMVVSSLQKFGRWNKKPSALAFYNGYEKLFELFSEETFQNFDFEGEDFTVGQGDKYISRSPILKSNTCEFLALYFTHSQYHTDLDIYVINKARIIVQKISERLSCPECMAALLSEEYVFNVDSIFKKRVIKPSRYVVKLIKTAETFLKTKFIFNKTVPEGTVAYIFREYCDLSNNLYLPETSNKHFTEEPYHIICLTRVIIKTLITFKVWKRIMFL